MKTFLVEMRDLFTFIFSVLAGAVLFVVGLQSGYNGMYWVTILSAVLIFALYAISKIVITGEPPKSVLDNYDIPRGRKVEKPPFWKTHGWKFWLVGVIVCTVYAISQIIVLIGFIAQRF